MGQAQINVRTRACSGTFIARTKQAALTHNVRGKELMQHKKLNELFSPQISYNSARRHLILYKGGSIEFPMNINRAFEI